MINDSVVSQKQIEFVKNAIYTHTKKSTHRNHMTAFFFFFFKCISHTHKDIRISLIICWVPDVHWPAPMLLSVLTSVPKNDWLWLVNTEALIGHQGHSCH